MGHEDQELELQELALTKDFDALLDELDESISNEDDDDGGFHAMNDGIQAGLRHSKKQCWAFQIGDDPLPDFNEGVFGFLIGNSFDEVKARLDKLPPRCEGQCES